MRKGVGTDLDKIGLAHRGSSGRDDHVGYLQPLSHRRFVSTRSAENPEQVDRQRQATKTDANEERGLNSSRTTPRSTTSHPMLSATLLSDGRFES